MQTSKLLMVAVVGLLFLTISGWSKYFSERRNSAEKLSVVSTEKAQLGNAYARLMSDNTALDNERRILETEYRVLQRRFASLDSSHRDLTQAHHSVQGQLVDTVDQRDRLSRSLAVTRGEQDAAREELDVIMQERSKLMDQLGLARELVHRARAGVTAGGSDLRHKLDQLKQSEQLVGLLGQRLTAANTEVEAGTRELERLNGRVGELSGELQSTNEEIQLLREEVGKWKAANQVAWSQLQDLQQRLEAELQSREIQIEQLKNNLTVIRLGGDILFDSGSAELRPAGIRALSLIADELGRYPDRAISLEGHTDAEPIGAALRDRFPSNWELSSARAARAARFLVANGIDAGRLRAVGYGQHRPAVAGGDQRQLARNRRIEIMLLPPREQVVVSRVPR